MKSALSRRGFLLGSAGAAGVAAATRFPFVREAHAETPSDTAVVLVYFSGGYNAIFPSATAFMSGGAFGVNAGNVTDVGGGRLVDKALLGSLTPARWARMAQVGVRHGLSNHDAAQNALWTTTKRQSRPLVLASTLGGDAAIKCAALGRKPPGFHGTEGSASMQVITSLGTVLAAYGKSVDPLAPSRPRASSGLAAAAKMSATKLGAAPVSGAEMASGYSSAVDLLVKPTPGLDSFALSSVAPLYGLPATVDAVADIRTQLLGAELMIRTGTRVVTVVDGGSPAWDTHGDASGELVRDQMGDRTPANAPGRYVASSLKAFLDRMSDPAVVGTTKVATVLFGDFSRSLPGSDHAANLTATVFGPRVKAGSTGEVDANVRLAAGTPGIDGLWAYIAALTGKSVAAWGANPHAAITL